ncbi:hypothetical protein DKX38_016260 [Salix brachista]|uniref:Laccase n=1 Tax=Salix brachista TaxID=2182728 RepID=A0A5N5L7H5_9ROSI|nr:hypothetical protein DKX38_016260 [Salix brachista]
MEYYRARTMLLVIFIFPALLVECKVRLYNFRVKLGIKNLAVKITVYNGCCKQVVQTNTTKLCSTKSIVTINGKFPGPTIYAREDDNVNIRLTNKVQYNVTVHWHGVRQLRTGWADGPAYVTQCPIQPGQSYLYNFTLTGQRGTLLWHAHISWLRATIHGAIVILPKKGVPYPFPKPDKEKIIILTRRSIIKLVVVIAFVDYVGEWWKADVEAVINQSTITGLPPNISDAHTVNGQTGAVPGCISPDHNLYFTIGVGIDPCATCTTGSHTVGDINNVSFIMPTKALLEAHYYNISGVFTDDFPAKPPISFNYTGNNTAMNLRTTNGTRAYRLAFNSTVQIVLQGTTVIAPESHPFHLHGFNFFVVGKGLGNFDPDNDPKKFNLADPVERNTVSVPTAGWIAIRFKADNPGVWFLHCHLEVHTTWGLKMAFVVDNGKGPDESILPPPSDLPTC